MRIVLALSLLLCLLISGSALAQQQVPGYTRRDGPYVQPYQRSAPNSTPIDNYSFKGNMNPFTGKQGHDYERSNPRSPYYDGSTPRHGGSLLGD